MECQNCKQEVEPGATFCGNCGHYLGASHPHVQAYAMAAPAESTAETKAVLSVLLGAAGLVGAVFMAFLGLAIGLAGIIMGTLSRSGRQKTMSTTGIVLSSVAVVASMAVWAYAFNHDAKVRAAHQVAQNGPVSTVNNLSTPCYSVGFIDKFNVTNSSGSCDMQAYNGQTVDTSTSAYKVFASKSDITSATTFTSLAKQALEKDVKNNLNGFTINSEEVGSFAGSPDYEVISTNSSGQVTVAEAAVFHQTKSGNNAFVLVHAVGGGKADFSDLENQWQWK